MLRLVTLFAVVAAILAETYWCDHVGKYLPGYTTGLSLWGPFHIFPNITEAKRQCLSISDCKGITYEPRIDRYTTRKGSELKESGNPAEISYTVCELDDQLVNIALNSQSTSQSSTDYGGVSNRAVDGNTNSHYNNGKSCTHTKTSGWWKVDLLRNYNIKKIVIYNRADCCSDRINGVKVYAGDKLCGTINYQSGKSKYTIECETTASSVKVDNKAAVLTLCEVEVFGASGTAHVSDSGWCEHLGKHLSGYSLGQHGSKLDNLSDAQKKCLGVGKRRCAGVTYEPGSRKYTLRRYEGLKESPSISEVTWTRC